MFYIFIDTDLLINAFLKLHGIELGSFYYLYNYDNSI